MLPGLRLVTDVLITIELFVLLWFVHAQVQNLRDVLGKVRLLGEAPDAAQLKALVDGGSAAADDYNRFANMASGIIAQLAKAGGWFQTNICNTVLVYHNYAQGIVFVLRAT